MQTFDQNLPKSGPDTKDLPNPPAVDTKRWAIKDGQVENEKSNTHLWIVNRSLEMVKTQESTDPKACAIIEELVSNHEYLGQLRRGLYDADNKDPYNGPLGTYAFHFYNPVTEQNYLEGDITALQYCTDCYYNSLGYYKKSDLARASYQLGLALHFLTDVGQPMHSANLTEIYPAPGYHSFFEGYVIDWIQRNEGNIGAEPYVPSRLGDTPGEYVRQAAIDSNLIGTDLFDVDKWDFNVVRWNTFGPPDKWKNAIEPIIRECLKKIRVTTAQFLMLWAKTVHNLLQAEASWSQAWALFYDKDNEQINVPTAADPTQLSAAGVPGGGERPEYAFYVAEENRRLHVLSGSTAVKTSGGLVWSVWGDLDIGQEQTAVSRTSGLASTRWLNGGADRGALAAYVDRNHHIHAVTPPAEGNSWRDVDLTLQAGNLLNALDHVVAACTLNAQYVAIVWVDVNGQIHALRSKGDSGSKPAEWKDINITNSVKGGLPDFDAGNSVLDVFIDQPNETFNIVYTDRWRHHVIWVQNAGMQWDAGWSYQDIHEYFKNDASVPLATGRHLACFEYTGLPNVFVDTYTVMYAAVEDGVIKIHQFLAQWFSGDNPNGWLHANVTADAEAPNFKIQTLRAIESPAEKAYHVICLDADGEIHALSYNRIDKWQYQNVSRLLQAESVSGPALSVYLAQQAVDNPVELVVLFMGDTRIGENRSAVNRCFRRSLAATSGRIDAAARASSGT